MKNGELLVQLDDAESAIELQAAKIRLESARTRYQITKSLHDVAGGARGRELADAETASRLAEIEVQRWELRMERARIVAPADGIVASLVKGIAVGRKVSAGDEVLTLRVPSATPSDGDENGESAPPTP